MRQSTKLRPHAPSLKNFWQVLRIAAAKYKKSLNETKHFWSGPVITFWCDCLEAQIASSVGGIDLSSGRQSGGSCKAATLGWVEGEEY